MNAHIRKGFTLIEMLVVVAVIGILISIGTASYSSVQQKSRDARRKGDLKSIQSAFEQYYAMNNGIYPAACSTIASDTTYFPGGFPKDPKSGRYYYTAGTLNGITIGRSCTGAGYYFGVSLEGTTTGGNATDDSCTNGSGAYFCVKNLQ